MTPELTNRYAVSHYVDLRLGLLWPDRRIHTREEATAKVARLFGSDAAEYAARQVD